MCSTGLASFHSSRLSRWFQVFRTIDRKFDFNILGVILSPAIWKFKGRNPIGTACAARQRSSRAQLEQQATKTSCRDSIHFLGYRDNIEQLYRAMDVFVLSSIAEGMP